MVRSILETIIYCARICFLGNRDSAFQTRTERTGSWRNNTRMYLEITPTAEDIIDCINLCYGWVIHHNLNYHDSEQLRKHNILCMYLFSGNRDSDTQSRPERAGSSCSNTCMYTLMFANAFR